MPRRKYDAKQGAALAVLAELHTQKVTQKAALRRQIEEQLRDALNDLELKESRQANVCIDLNISKTDIGRALGTANWETINSTLQRTAMPTVDEAAVEDAGRFSVDGNTLTVTLDRETVAELMHKWHWPEGSEPLTTAEFEADTLLPITPLADESTDWLQHPVVTWMMEPANLVAARSYIERQSGKVAA